MRLVFMGTAAFAVPSLEALVATGHEVAGVVTQPDRPAGRGRKLRASPVKEAAQASGIDVYQPESLKSDDVVRAFPRLNPELLVVVAYGKIIPAWLRAIPEYGAINVHGSLLPRYRGAAPVHWAIARGESETGVCTMAIDAGLDTGPVYDCESTEIGPNETVSEVSQRLSALGAQLLVRTIQGVVRGDAAPRPQNDALATMARCLRKEDGRIRWELPAQTIHNAVRAFLPWPSVVVGFRGTPCRILETRCGSGAVAAADPGAIGFAGGKLQVCCGDGRLLEVVQLQLENRKAVSGPDFARGVRLQPGDRFTRIGE